jgi:hypothetical protein
VVRVGIKRESSAGMFAEYLTAQTARKGIARSGG